MTVKKKVIEVGVEDFNDESKLDDINPDELFSGAVYYTNKGNHQKAYNIFKQLLSKYPDYTDENNDNPWYYLGNIFINADMYDEAIDSYKKSIEIDPSDCDSMSKIAWCHYHKGELEEALFNATLAIKTSDISGRKDECSTPEDLVEMIQNKLKKENNNA